LAVADLEQPSFSITQPTLIELAHPELSAGGLFQLAYALDGYELRPDPADPRRRIKETVTVDVLEVTPTSSKIRITPKRKLSQLELMAVVDQLLSQAPRGIVAEKLRIERIAWDVPGAGMASDERGSLGRIK
jgi:hypothetical protein